MTIRPSRSNRRGIGSFLKWLYPKAAHGVEKALLGLTLFYIDFQQALDRVGDLPLRHRRADDGAQGSIRAGGAADGDLIPLFAALIDAEDADVADVMVTAGVHAPGHLDVDLAQIVQIVVVVELLVDEFRNLDGAGIGET